MGVEPTSSAWKADIMSLSLPLYDTRIFVGRVGFEPTFSTYRYVYRMYKIPTVPADKTKNPIISDWVSLISLYFKSYNIIQPVTYAPAPPPIIAVPMLFTFVIIIYILNFSSLLIQIYIFFYSCQIFFKKNYGKSCLAQNECTENILCELPPPTTSPKNCHYSNIF